MKNSYLNSIVFLILVLGITSCQKEETPIEPDFISSSINDSQWEGLPKTRTFQENDSLVIFGISSEQNLKEFLVFKIKFNGEGEYDLNSSTIFYTLLEGDIETNMYRLDENSNSQFTITEFDPEQNIIKGNFDMSLLLEHGDPDINEDKLVFQKGLFKATMSN